VRCKVERFNFLMGQVVLGDTGIGTVRPAAGPCVRPMLGWLESARRTITSAAVWPCAAQCILF
jgi:hypothetical protein